MLTTTARAPRQRGRAVSAVVVAVLSVAGPLTAGEADAAAHVGLDSQLSRPHLLSTRVADVLVSIRGGTVCTGTPVSGPRVGRQTTRGTNLVVTAAHCVLDLDGQVAGSRTVLREDVAYTAEAVLINPEYRDSPIPRFDAAVLVLDRIIPGPSATLGDAVPADGLATLAGLQPLDTDGSLLRGTRYDNRPHPSGATGVVTRIRSAAVGCESPVTALEITESQWRMPCGLIPGASGGGLFVERSGELFLVGIVSTVAADLAYNGLVPLDAVHELLESPARYTYELDGRSSATSGAKVIRS